MDYLKRNNLLGFPIESNTYSLKTLVLTSATVCVSLCTSCSKKGHVNLSSLGLLQLYFLSLNKQVFVVGCFNIKKV